MTGPDGTTDGSVDGTGAWDLDGASVALAHRHAPGLVAAPGPTGTAQDERERPITVDQTNRSVVVDEVVIVKWFTTPVPLPHPGLDTLAHLAEHGVDAVPRLFGVEHVDGTVTATVSEYVAGALDGWDWFVDELLAGAHGEGGDAPSWSARIGSLAARVHLALARPSAIRPQPVGRTSIVAEIDRCRHLVEEVNRSTLPGVVEVIAPRFDRIVTTIAALDDIGETSVQPIHADLHVGQFLRAGDRLVVTDFDGDPIGGDVLARRPRPAAVDVASLLQSIDHAGRIAIRRAPEHTEPIGRLLVVCAEVALDTYRETLHASERTELLDERLLSPLRVAQELHELVYAERHLPRWAYAPLGTLTAMFPVDDTHQADRHSP